MTRAAYARLLLLMLCVAAAVLLLCAGPVRPPQPLGVASRSPLSGVTLDRVTTPEGPRLIVTSLRGGDPPVGLAVGDRIEDIDGLPAVSLSALRGDLDRDRANPLELHVRRGGRIIAVAVARETMGGGFGSQDSSGRGRSDHR